MPVSGLPTLDSFHIAMRLPGTPRADGGGIVASTWGETRSRAMAGRWPGWAPRRRHVALRRVVAFPAEVISHASHIFISHSACAWSRRCSAARGIIVSRVDRAAVSVGVSARTSPTRSGEELPCAGDEWHLDEVAIKSRRGCSTGCGVPSIRTVWCWMCWSRAGATGSGAAKRLLRRAAEAAMPGAAGHGHRQARPATARRKKELMPGIEHRRHKRPRRPGGTGRTSRHGDESSRKMKRFKSARRAQKRFLSAHEPIGQSLPPPPRPRHRQRVPRREGGCRSRCQPTFGRDCSRGLNSVPASPSACQLGRPEGDELTVPCRPADAPGRRSASMLKVRRRREQHPRRRCRRRAVEPAGVRQRVHPGPPGPQRVRVAHGRLSCGDGRGRRSRPRRAVAESGDSLCMAAWTKPSRPQTNRSFYRLLREVREEGRTFVVTSHGSRSPSWRPAAPPRRAGRRPARSTGAAGGAARGGRRPVEPRQALRALRCGSRSTPTSLPTPRA